MPYLLNHPRFEPLPPMLPILDANPKLPPSKMPDVGASQFGGYTCDVSSSMEIGLVWGSNVGGIEFIMVHPDISPC